MMYSGFGRILVLVVLVGLFLFGGTALAANQSVTVTLDANGNLVCPNFGQLNAGDILTVINGTVTKNIQVAYNGGAFGAPLSPGQQITFVGTNSCDKYGVWLSAKGNPNYGYECPPSIPTLSEWAMIVFSVLLLGMMTYYVIRRRRTAQVTAF
ncbi:MAG: IPTL-CTERM sorting domain-containing protein [candidate division Zixibacteria bacterium]|nr:IPTL-CTERM sorting domain-containing protein [candidate division Zixibacteria bacterium]